MYLIPYSSNTSRRPLCISQSYLEIYLQNELKYNIDITQSVTGKKKESYGSVHSFENVVCLIRTTGITATHLFSSRDACYQTQLQSIPMLKLLMHSSKDASPSFLVILICVVTIQWLHPLHLFVMPVPSQNGWFFWKSM
jgi:hypothetical protein